MWGTHKVYIHSDIRKHEMTTPFTTLDIHGNTIHSKIEFEVFPDKEVELKHGDYIMMSIESEVKKDGDQACGHMHYYNGRYLVSVYTKNKYRKKTRMEKL